jgi:hypothetical protein
MGNSAKSEKRDLVSGLFLSVVLMSEILVAMGVSYVANRIHGNHTIKRSLLWSVVVGTLGAVLGMTVFGATLLQLGMWITLFEALLLFGAFGVIGAYTRSMSLGLAWTTLICFCRFGMTIDVVAYVAIGCLAVLAGLVCQKWAMHRTGVKTGRA